MRARKCDMLYLDGTRASPEYDEVWYKKSCIKSIVYLQMYAFFDYMKNGPCLEYSISITTMS
jgi:hypothetical protein